MMMLRRRIFALCLLFDAQYGASGLLLQPISSNRVSRFPLSVDRRSMPSVRPCHQPLHDVGMDRRRLLRGVTFAALLDAISLFNLPSCQALTPDEASTAYDSFAPTYDQLDGGKVSSLLGLDMARSETFRAARGDVLEIGAGTGLNLDKYDASLLKSLTLVDISDGMLQQAKARVQELAWTASVPVRFVKADATSELVAKFGENAFDTAVDSFSLCVMGNDGANACLQELRGVVKPKTEGGKILLLENTRSSSPILGWYQDVTAEAAASNGGKGCVYNQDVTDLIMSTAGLTIEKEVGFVGGLFHSYECTKYGVA